MATPANAISSRKLKLEDILDLRAYERIREESLALVLALLSPSCLRTVKPCGTRFKK